MAKRSLESTSASAKRRVKPAKVEQTPFQIVNLKDGDVLHQTCILVDGTCPALDYNEETTFISVWSDDAFTKSKSATHWPLNKGQWKALVMLTPGSNTITFQLHHAGGISDALKITVNYIPLLQLPPLHLAILVASDSPLLIDCPPAKYGGISTAHSSLDAAIAKLRMSAYMWQALTAEDFRQKGMGRRSFRLEEEWMSNTTLQAGHQMTPGDYGRMAAVAKVHIIRSDKSVAEIRDADVAQQNPRGRNRDDLHRYFEEALAKSGGLFESRCRPVVAGMILDSHYSVEKSMIMGHAALGCHKPDGISLGIFGSHLTYSWPRFLEEVPACLTDMAVVGDTVGNDNGECDTMRGACFVGQGAFLHEVGHAFGADHTTGIMARGYSKSWAMNFIEHKTNNNMVNDARWDIRDALRFKLLPHFAIPGDRPVSNEYKNAAVRIQADLKDEEAGSDEKFSSESLSVSCSAGLAQVTIQSGEEDPKVYYKETMGNDWTGQCTRLSIDTIAEQLDRAKSLKITALGMNGKERMVTDAWKLLKERPYMLIPGSDLVIRKQSVRCELLTEENQGDELAPWAMLLQHRGRNGQLYRATSIDLRVGCTMDGAVVHYADGTHENCGPARDQRGHPHNFGGHASESHDLPENETITRVLIRKEGPSWAGSLSGIRMSLSNGDKWGHLDGDYDTNSNIGTEEDGEDGGLVALEPTDGEVIVGFYGQSYSRSGYTFEFGILTAPEGVELPHVVYDMPELSNI
ncbi:peptidase family-domain-containing protein [Penicillium odoratum]|uniref:peptidase family-domain-containing protein n=1 Tax=Penicillium odoratum TaxID=1167516 RepID=UPI0025476359|nr:peptidase family-domain-containing protein [Penicillium odoratum]KAJ5777154.1 peptidase family-domain-containing protein [Penicillium odoratum]